MAEADFEKLLENLFSGDDTLAEPSAIRMAEHGEKAISFLIPSLESPNPDERWWTIRALAEFKNVDLADHFIDGLEDEDLAVQQCAALALRNHPDPYAIPELIALLKEQDPLLVRLAADALAAIGEPATKPLLQVVTHSKIKRARLNAVRALAIIGDKASIAVLFRLMDEDSALLEYWASEGLDKMGIGMRFFSPK